MGTWFRAELRLSETLSLLPPGLNSLKGQILYKQSKLDLTYIELAEHDGFHFASAEDKLKKGQQYSAQAMQVALGAIKVMAKNIAADLKDFGDIAAPDEIEVEFGLKLELEAGMSGSIIPWITKTTTGGQFTVKAKWNLNTLPKVNTASK